jgi:hypothetical protein
VKQNPIIIYIILLSTLLSCTTVKIASNKASNHHKKLSKVFVIIQTETKASKFSKSFATKLMTAFKEYHIQGEFALKHTLSLETNVEYDQKIEKFKPKQLITIKQTAINFRAPSIIDAIVFEINIIDTKNNQIIWKGELDVYGQVGLDDTINKTLKKLTNRIKADKLL